MRTPDGSVQWRTDGVRQATDHAGSTHGTGHYKHERSNMKSPTLTHIALALCMTFGIAAHAQTMSKSEFKMAKEKIENDYKAAQVPCASLSGNPKKICTVEAKGSEKVALANLDASNKPSAKSQREARDTQAEAVYALAKQKCQDLAGNAKDVCIKQAKSAETTAKADAKLQLKTSEANADARSTTQQAANKASDKVQDARSEATTDKADAQYKVEKEKCDTFAGAAKDNCITQAKVRFAK